MVIVKWAVVICLTAALMVSRNSAGSTLPVLAVLSLLGAPEEGAVAPGSSAVAALLLLPHAAREPSASGSAAATAALRRGRVRMSPPGGSGGRAPLPMSGGRPPGVPDGSFSLTG